jgi:SAM-dependent methyltransferase
MTTDDPKDPFARANYRSLIAWGPRIEREAPFLDRAFAALPERSVADLGCGTGEHSRHLAAHGYRVTGLDASASMIETALDTPVAPGLRFVLGDIRDADRVLGEKFGAALCLGNTLSFFDTDAELHRALGAIARLLLPGGRFLFQVLNYERLYARDQRHLPLNFRPAADGEIVFIRLLDLRPGGRVVFMPTTLQVRPDCEEPVELVRTRRVELRAWTCAELLPALTSHGFTDIALFGTMANTPFDPLESLDLVVLCTKAAS